MESLQQSISTSDGASFLTIPKEKFEKFGPSMVGLGNLDSPPVKQKDIVAAIFDLQGFTTFCNQEEPQSQIPMFLEKFFFWLFDSMKEHFRRHVDGDTVYLWANLPDFMKFTGDGMLFIWDLPITGYKGSQVVGNIIVGLHDVCRSYKEDFFPKVKEEVSRPPSVLRCGIARGNALSLCGGSDYVGTCINLASRLQKPPDEDLTFAFSKAGFDPKVCFDDKYRSRYILLTGPIRGVGDERLFFVAEEEFKALSKNRQNELLKAK